jgi:hypothetical protein
MAQDPSYLPDEELIRTPSGTYVRRPRLLARPDIIVPRPDADYDAYKQGLLAENAQRNFKFATQAPVTQGLGLGQVFGDTLDYHYDLETGEYKAEMNESSSIMGRYLANKWRYTTGIVDWFSEHEPPDPNFEWTDKSFHEMRKEIPTRFWDELREARSEIEAKKFVARIKSDEDFMGTLEGFINMEKPGVADELMRFNDKWMLPMTDPIPLAGAVLVDRGAALVGRIANASRIAAAGTQSGMFTRGVGIHAAAEGLWGTAFTAMADAGSPYIESDEYVFNTGFAALLGGIFGGLELRGFARGELGRVAALENLNKQVADVRFSFHKALQYATDPIKTEPFYMHQAVDIMNRATGSQREAIRGLQGGLWRRLEREVFDSIEKDIRNYPNMSPKDQEVVRALQVDWIVRHPEGAKLLQEMYEEIGRRYDNILRSTKEGIEEPFLTSYLDSDSTDQFTNPFLNKLDLYNPKTLNEILDGGGNITSLHADEALNTIPREAVRRLELLEDDLVHLQKSYKEALKDSDEAADIARAISRTENGISYRQFEEELNKQEKVLARDKEALQKVKRVGPQAETWKNLRKKIRDQERIIEDISGEMRSNDVLDYGNKARSLDIVKTITGGHSGLLSMKDIDTLSKYNPAVLAGLDLADLIRLVGQDRMRARELMKTARGTRDAILEEGFSLENRVGDLVTNRQGEIGLLRGIDKQGRHSVDYDDFTPNVARPWGKARKVLSVEEEYNVRPARSEDLSTLATDASYWTRRAQRELGDQASESAIRRRATQLNQNSMFPNQRFRNTEYGNRGKRRVGMKMEGKISGFNVTIVRNVPVVGGKKMWNNSWWKIHYTDVDGTQGFLHPNRLPPDYRFPEGRVLGTNGDDALIGATKAQAIDIAQAHLAARRAVDFSDKEHTGYLMGVLRSDLSDEGFNFLHPPDAPPDPFISLAAATPKGGDPSLTRDWYRMSLSGELAPAMRGLIDEATWEMAPRSPEARNQLGAAFEEQAAKDASLRMERQLAKDSVDSSEAFDAADLMADQPRLSKWWRVVSLGGWRTKMLSHDIPLVVKMSNHILGGPAALTDNAGNYHPVGGPIGSVLQGGARQSRRMFVNSHMADVYREMLDSMDEYKKLRSQGMGQAIRGDLEVEFKHHVARFITSGGKILPPDKAAQDLVTKAARPVIKKFKDLLKYAQDTELKNFAGIKPDDAYYSRIAQTGKFESITHNALTINGRGPVDQLEDFITEAISKGEGWDEEGARALAIRLRIFYNEANAQRGTVEEMLAHASPTVESRLDALEHWLGRKADGSNTQWVPFTDVERGAIVRNITRELRTSKRTMMKVKFDPTVKKTFRYKNGQKKEMYIGDLFEEDPMVILDRYASDIYTHVQEQFFLKRFPVNGEVMESIPTLFSVVMRTAENMGYNKMNALRHEMKALQNVILGRPQFSRSQLGAFLSILRGVTGVLRVPGFVKAQLPETMAAATSGGFNHVIDSHPAFTRMIDNAKNGTISEHTLRDTLSMWLGMGDVEGMLPLLYHHFDLLNEGMPLFGAGKAGKAYSYAARAQPRVGIKSGYTALNVYGDMWAFNSYLNRMAHMARTGKGVDDFVGRRNVRLAQLGMTRREFDELLDALRTHGVMETDQLGRLTLDKIRLEKLSPEMQARLRGSSAQWIRQVMQRSDIMDRPLWLMTTEFGDLLTQFKAFSLSSQMNHVGRNIQLRDSLAMQQMFSQMVGAVGVSIALAYLYYWDEPEKLAEELTTPALIRASSRKVAWFGMIPDLTDAAMHTMGFDPVFTNMHEPTLIKFPAFSTLADIGRVPGTLWDAAQQGHLDQQQYRRLLRVVPLANAWYSSVASNLLIEPNLPPPQE